MHLDRSHWSTEPLKILAVSPHEHMRENLYYSLDFFSEATVYGATDSAMATGRIDQMTPDLIIAEVDWITGDAFRLAADVRKARTRLDISTPIILLTWRATCERILAAQYLAVDSLLLIPYSAKSLQTRVVAVLDRHRYRESVREIPAARSEVNEWSEHIEAAPAPVSALTQAEIELLLRPAV